VANDKINKSGERTAAEEIDPISEELMDGRASGDEGYSEMWPLLLEGALAYFSDCH